MHGSQDHLSVINRVLLPLDGSHLSEWAIPNAVGLARAVNAAISVVQVVPSGGPPTITPKGDVLESSYVRSKADRILRDYDLEADWDVLHGNPGPAICEYVGELQGVVLAMSSHGRTGVPRAILGSVAGECVRRAGVPVLIQYAL